MEVDEADSALINSISLADNWFLAASSSNSSAPDALPLRELCLGFVLMESEAAEGTEKPSIFSALMMNT